MNSNRSYVGEILSNYHSELVRFPSTINRPFKYYDTALYTYIRSTESNKANSDIRNFLIEIELEEIRQFPWPTYVRYKIKVQESNTGKFSAEINIKYDSLLFFVELIKQEYPFLILPYFPERCSDELEVAKFSEVRFKSLKTFFENCLENPFIDAEQFVIAIRDFQKTTDWEKCLNDKKIKNDILNISIANVYNQQFDTYKKLNINIDKLKELVDLTHNLHCYFSLMKKRSQYFKDNVIGTILCCELNKSNGVPDELLETIDEQIFDCDNDTLTEIVELIKVLKFETKNTYDLNYQGLKSLIGNKQLKTTSKGGNLGDEETVSEGFRWDDLREEEKQKLSICLKKNDYSSIMENRTIFEKFTEDQIQGIFVLENQLKFLVEGYQKDLEIIFGILLNYS